MRPRPDHGLVLHPGNYTPLPYKVPKTSGTSGYVTGAHHLPMWSTPRAVNGAKAMYVLTKRGARDLGTQIRFEQSTPPAQRLGGATNPEWAEWLMGFPRGWTSANPLELPAAHSHSQPAAHRHDLPVHA
jgi:hypothetical protein